MVGAAAGVSAVVGFGAALGAAGAALGAASAAGRSATLSECEHDNQRDESDDPVIKITHHFVLLAGFCMGSGSTSTMDSGRMPVRSRSRGVLSSGIPASISAVTP